MLMSRLRQIDAPRRLVILERELAARRAQVPQRRREPLRPRRLAVVVAEAREVVAAVPSSRPASASRSSRPSVIVMSGCRLNAGTQSSATAICFAVKNGRSPGCRPSIGRSSTQDLAGEQVDSQRADVQRPLDVLRAGVLGPGAHRRAEIDRDRRRRSPPPAAPRRCVEAEADVAEDSDGRAGA